MKVGGEVEAGKPSAIEVGFAGETFELAFAAQASLKEPLVAKGAIKIPETKLQFGGWEFSGAVSGEFEIGIGPNYARIAARAAEKAAEKAVESLALEEALEAGEEVSVMATGSSTVASVAIAGGAAGAAIGWLGLVLYEIGSANIEGEKQAVRNSHNNGYSRALAALTSNHAFIRPAHEAADEEEKEATDKAIADEFMQYLSMNWLGQLTDAEKRYLDAPPGPEGARQRDSASFDADEAGTAHAVQQAMAIVGEEGANGMNALRKHQQALYGADEQARKQAYHDILRAAPLGGPAPTVKLER